MSQEFGTPTFRRRIGSYLAIRSPSLDRLASSPTRRGKGRENLVHALLGQISVIVLIRDHHRGKVARRQALHRLKGELTVGGRLAGADSQALADMLDDIVGSPKVAGDILAGHQNV